MCLKEDALLLAPRTDLGVVVLELWVSGRVSGGAVDGQAVRDTEAITRSTICGAWPR